MMTNASIGEPLDRLAAVRKAQYVPPSPPSPPSTTRFWWYQTCTEFAFYQTCETGSKCFFTQGLNVEHPLESPSGKYQNDFCQSEHNISTDATNLFVRRSNQFYEDLLLPTATRIIWPNGDVDPWHGLSHLAPQSAEQPKIFPIRGAAHCAWMASAADDDQQSVKDARAEIFGTLKKWLAEDAAR